MRKTVRVLTVSPDNESLWVRLSVQPIGGRWAATLIWAGQRRLSLVRWGTFGEGVSWNNVGQHSLSRWGMASRATRRREMH
jgi:hypothetical protein